MAQKTVKLGESDLKYFSDVDNSILKWSVDLGKAALRVRQTEETLATLYQARQRKMAELISAAGVDPSACSNALVDAEGVLHLEVEEREPTEVRPAPSPA